MLTGVFGLKPSSLPPLSNIFLKASSDIVTTTPEQYFFEGFERYAHDIEQISRDVQDIWYFQKPKNARKFDVLRLATKSA